MHRLMPDGSGPATIDLSSYRRVFVIALGKAAGPMLETLLERMKRRKGLRGICCTNQQPKKPELAVPLFRGRAPAAQRGYICRGAGDAGDVAQGQERHADFLPDLGGRIGNVRSAD